MPHPEWWTSRKTGYAFKMPVVGLGIFAVLLKALRNAQGVNKEHLWVCLSGCFQRGFIKEGRPRVNAGSDILWAGVHLWLNDKEPAWSQMSTSLYLSASRLRILRSHWPHAPDSSLHWWPLSCWLRSRAPASPSSLKLLLVRFFGHGHGKNNCVKMGKFKGHRIFHGTNNRSKEAPQLSKHTEGDRGDPWRWRRRGAEITLDREKHDRAVSRKKLTHWGGPHEIK